VVTAPAATLYLTLWASDEVTTHFGKTEGADERCMWAVPGFILKLSHYI